jgi:uncharacterized protein YjbI with pentapeptide repeats
MRALRGQETVEPLGATAFLQHFNPASSLLAPPSLTYKSAYLDDAHLEGSNLSWAHLENANLSGSHP